MTKEPDTRVKVEVQLSPLINIKEEPISPDRQEPDFFVKQERASPSRSESVSQIKEQHSFIKQETVPVEIKTDAEIKVVTTAAVRKPPPYRNKTHVPAKHRIQYNHLLAHQRAMYWKLPKNMRHKFLNMPYELQPYFVSETLGQRRAWRPQRAPCPAPQPEVIDLAYEYLDPSLKMWQKNTVFKIGIWDITYMPYDKLEILKRAIVMSIMADCNNTIIPRIHDCVEQNGWLQVTCKDVESCRWVCSTVERLQPWQYAQFRARRCDEVENYLVAAVSVNYKDVKTVNEMVTLLNKQNVGLTADLWRVNNVTCNGEYLKVEFTLTDGQISELRRIDYNLTVGLSKAIVQLRSF